MAEMLDSDSEQSCHGVPIRSVSRAFQALECINRLNHPTIMEIKEDCNLPYATVYRIIKSLMHDGWIEVEESRKRYRPAQKVWSLVCGFQTEDLLVSTARNHLVQLTNDLHWPVTLSVRVGNSMMVKDSTHTITAQTFANYYPGYTLPILSCGAGKAYLAFCPDEERETLLEAARQSTSDEVKFSLQIVEEADFLTRIRRQGYASHARVAHNDTPGKTSSLAVPLIVGGHLEATLALVYFEKSMTEAQAIERYVEPLKQAASRISDEMA